MDGYVTYFFVIVLFALLIWSLAYQHQEQQKIKDELYKLVRQAGAQNISIERERFIGNRGLYFFSLTYQDAVGKWQSRQVSRQMGFLGQAQGEFMWDHPLISEPDPQLSSRLSSKEQIISDMDAEIKRLQQELEKSRQEN
ncbi:MAG: hypothetical protein KJ069_31255 [Anaerolineae bacterium]|nr:hypothetical protein [Anaerolineae bacterium]